MSCFDVITVTIYIYDKLRHFFSLYHYDITTIKKRKEKLDFLIGIAWVGFCSAFLWFDSELKKGKKKLKTLPIWINSLPTCEERNGQLCISDLIKLNTTIHHRWWFIPCTFYSGEKCHFFRYSIFWVCRHSIISQVTHRPLRVLVPPSRWLSPRSNSLFCIWVSYSFCSSSASLWFLLNIAELGGLMGSKPWLQPAPTYRPLETYWDSDEDAPGPRCGHTLTSVAATKDHGPRLILFGGATAIEGGPSSGISNLSLSLSLEYQCEIHYRFMLPLDFGFWPSDQFSLYFRILYNRLTSIGLVRLWLKLPTILVQNLDFFTLSKWLSGGFVIFAHFAQDLPELRIRCIPMMF